jgi:hypothetical protein
MNRQNDKPSKFLLDCGRYPMNLQRFLLTVLTFSSLQPLVLAQRDDKIEGRAIGRDEKALINDVTDKTPAIELDARSQKFQKLMSGAKLTGLFTVQGKPMKDLTEDTYEIRKVEKRKSEGDEWVITARVKYGKNDYEMPFPIQVKWAGETPVLTIEKFAVPGMGVFSARVLLHGTQYAGTWQHDEVGGHMFGKIILPEAADGTSSEPAKPK